VGENGTPHLQGFFNLIEKKRFKCAKELIGARCHIEAAIATDDDNDKYCSKGGDFWRVGEPSTRGKRNDLTLAIKKVQEEGLKRCAEDYGEVFVKFHRGLQHYQSLVAPPKARDFATRVHVLWGPPGTGKSLTASWEASHSGYEVYYKSRGEWWDGYTQQEAVVIDDFYGWIKYDELLKICDRYPYQVTVKGAYQVFYARDIWITSNSPVTEWYKFDGFDANTILTATSTWKESKRWWIGRRTRKRRRLESRC